MSYLFTVMLPVLPTNKDASFGLKLRNDNLFGRTYIQDVTNLKSSLAAKSFGDFQCSRQKLRDL